MMALALLDEWFFINVGYIVWICLDRPRYGNVIEGSFVRPEFIVIGIIMNSGLGLASIDVEAVGWDNISSDSNMVCHRRKDITYFLTYYYYY